MRETMKARGDSVDGWKIYNVPTSYDFGIDRQVAFGLVAILHDQMF